MSIFNSILQKLGLQKPAAPAAAAPAKPAAPAPMPPRPMPSQMNVPDWKPPTVAPVAQPAPVAMPMVDVVSQLNALAQKSPIELDWKVSIVDLLKLLGMDASGASINELAIELGCPASEMSDSARRNIWLHQAVLQKIAANGGNIPASLLHK